MLRKEGLLMLGVLVNTVAVVIGGIIGTLFKKHISEKVSSAILGALGLCITVIGISGALKGENTLIAIASMVLGTAVGTAADIDGKLNRLGRWVERKLVKEDSKTSLAEGMVTGTLLFCIGSMTIIGSLNAGISHDNEMLYTKAMLDGITSIMLATTLGIGICLSAVSVGVIEGGLTLLAVFISRFLTDSATVEMNCVGSIIIMAIGLNMCKITKFKVANFIPAIVFAPLITIGLSYLPV